MSEVYNAVASSLLTNSFNDCGVLSMSAALAMVTRDISYLKTSQAFNIQIHSRTRTPRSNSQSVSGSVGICSLLAFPLSVSLALLHLLLLSISNS